jgi:hypothetical protein
VPCIADESCPRPVHCRGLCGTHYQRWRTTGRTDLVPRATPEEMFWANVDKTGLCWLWTGGCNDRGYGQMRIDGRQTYAHRFAYELLVEPLSEDMLLDHRTTCSKHCVTPGHLRPVSNKQNLENLVGAHRDSQTGVRGVTWREERKQYRVTVGHNYHQYFGGHFTTLAEAEAAAIALRNRLFTHNDVDRRAS